MKSMTSIKACSFIPIQLAMFKVAFSAAYWQTSVVNEINYTLKRISQPIERGNNFLKYHNAEKKGNHTFIPHIAVHTGTVGCQTLPVSPRMKKQSPL